MAKKKASPRKKKGQKPPPQCKAILLCERTIVEKDTENISIIGCFNNFLTLGFPAITLPCFVFMQLVSGIDDYNILVEIHDLTQDEVLARAEIANINFVERSQKLHLIIPIPALPLTHPGAYDLVVLANNQEIDRQQFVAKLRGEQGNDQSANG